MNECFTFCILAETGLQTFTPMYVALLMLISAALIASAVLTGNGTRKIMPGKSTQVCLVLVLQLVVLSSFQAKYAQVVKHGKILKLSVNQSDPVDFFRGNYQALTYPDSIVYKRDVRFHDLANADKDSIVYVVFQDKGEVWRATDVYNKKPVLTPAIIFLRARVLYNAGESLSVHYGIEQYFFEQGKQVNMGSSAVAYVHVDDNGDAVLTDLVP